ncbi:MAG: hypothetical protein AB1793_08235 [Candidatus Thermoplasmatota archaeon]
MGVGDGCGPVSPAVVPAAHIEAEDETLAQSPRTVDHRWYDLFDVPLGDWWDKRWEVYAVDEPLTDSFPYLVRHHYEMGSHDTFSGARLNVTGREIPEVNTTYDPRFLPLLSGDGGARGGNARIDWYMQYISPADYYQYPPQVTDWDDGWLVALNGTVTLDQDAAMSVLGMPSSAWSDFSGWWSSNAVAVENGYTEWLLAEGNDDPLDIFPMYEYPLVPLIMNLAAAREGDEVVLTYDTLTWGMEAMMTRWMRDAFMPTEWWFEDMSFHAQIGPAYADLDIDTAVPYAVRAWEAKDAGSPCWVWQGMLQDRIESSVVHPVSAFDRYCDLTREWLSPGSPGYGATVPYKDVPACFDLSPGETLSLTWPDAPILFMEHVSTGVVSNTTAAARVAYMEPMPVDMPGAVSVDPAQRTVLLEGPLDLEAWAEGQCLHENLSAEWDRLGALPCGLPYIELTMAGENSPPFACLSAEHDPDANVSSAFLLDAGSSCDADDPISELLCRWDLDGDGSWDTAWGDDFQAWHDFEVVGTHAPFVEVMDSEGASDTCSVEVVITDVDPPETTVWLSGLEGCEGWFVSDVTVNLSSVDAGPVESTWCSLDGGDWTMYSGSVQVSSDGLHTVEFYSVDWACNVEGVCSCGFGMDRGAPEVSFVTSSELYSTGDVTVVWSCSDALSGVNRSELSLDGARYIPFGSATSHAFLGLVEGIHTVFLRVYDTAGNAASDSYTFTVDLGGDDGGDPTDPGGGADYTLVYLGVIAAVVAAVVAAAVVVARRKR